MKKKTTYRTLADACKALDETLKTPENKGFPKAIVTLNVDRMWSNASGSKTYFEKEYVHDYGGVEKIIKRKAVVPSKYVLGGALPVSRNGYVPMYAHDALALT